MACPKHNLAMLRLALRGDVRSPRHARLLQDIRSCRWCRPPVAVPPRETREEPAVPRPRTESPVFEQSRR